MHATRPGRSRTRRRTRSKRAVKSPYYEAGTRGLRPEPFAIARTVSPAAGVGTWVVLRISRRHRLDCRTEGLDVAFAGAEGGSRLS